MKYIYNKLTSFTVFAVVFAMALSVSAQRPYRATDLQVQAVITRIETRTETLKQQIERFASRNNDTQITTFITDFESSTENLSNNFTSRNSSSTDVQEVLNRAAYIENYMRNNRVSNTVQTQWNLIRTDLNTLAGYYRVSTNWNTVPTYPNNPNNPVYNGTDNQVTAIIRRIETRTDTFRQQITRFDNRRDTQRSEQLMTYVTEFENATDSLSTNFTSRRSSSADVQEVLNRAAVIDSFMRTSPVNNAVQNQWNLLRTDLNTLANYYRVSWNWDRIPTNPNNYPNDRYNRRSFDSRLTGTYRLNSTQSDNVSTVIDRALGNNSYNGGNDNQNQRDRVRRQLERRLTAPDMLVIEKQGQQITMASSLSQQVVFDADGVSRTETNTNGRSIQIRAAATNNDLTIDYEGDRMNDFNVSFTPMNNGQLRVTRRVYLENRNETVTVNSVYDKTDQVARWNNITLQNQNDTYSNNDYRNNYPNNGNNNDQFIVENNTRLMATLDTPLSTRKFSDGDRFSMTVTSPGQYQGAVIEGRINGSKSGVVSGRANLTMDFETIRLRNGSTYRFAGIVDQVREPDGDMVSVNNEGTIRDSNQTKKTVTRAGIGAALGAIIGAIAGGGQGAVIGAGVGAGAGAGSVILQGRDNLELPSGTEFSLTATAPTNR